jgi:hypothetical protein
MILIEDQFAGVEITDGDADQIEVVGAPIHYIETRIVLKGSTGEPGFPKILFGLDARRGRIIALGPMLNKECVLPTDNNTYGYLVIRSGTRNASTR